jgi:antitoxin protein of toxin-antitoxin system
MGFLDDAKEKISDLIDGHSDKVEGGIEKAGDVVDDKTGGKFEGKVDVAQDKTADALDSLDGKNDDLA